jgi:hypothetical protein
MKAQKTKATATSKDLKSNVGRTIQIIKCSLDNPVVVNLTPGSTHIVIDAPKGQKLSKDGVWVEGVGDQVMLLNEEFDYVTDVVEPKKLTLKEKRALKKAEEEAAVVEEVTPQPETKKKPAKKKPAKKKVEKVAEEEVAEKEVVEKVEDTAEKPVEEPKTATHKVCRVCGVNHPIDQYGRDKSTKDGLSSVCKPCEKIYRSPEARAERARKKAEREAKKAAEAAAKKAS